MPHLTLPPTRRNFKLITPIQKFPQIQQIEAIQPVQAVQPIYKYQGLDDKQRVYRQAKQDKQTQTFLSNYNDPTELNSYIDALTNREAVAKKFGDTWADISTTAGTASLVADIASIVLSAAAWIVSALLPDAGAIGAAGTVGANAIKAASAASKAAKAVKIMKTTAKGLSTASKVLAVPAIPAAVDVTVEKSIKPIFAGRADEAALNTLMNLGETMDARVNPIKGLILDGPDGFTKALGVGSNGRTNYDFDTGCFVTDVLLEIAVDPVNFIQLGSGIVQRKAIKNVATDTSRTLIDSTLDTAQMSFKDVFKDITEESRERVFKDVNKATTSVTKEWAEVVADGFETEAKKLAARGGKFYNRLSKEEKQHFIELAQKTLREKGQKKIQTSLISAIKKEFPEATANDIDLLLKKSGKNYYNNAVLKSATEQISDITYDTLSSQIVRSTADLIKVADDSDRLWMKRALFTSGYGLGIEVIKDGFQHSKIWAKNLSIAKLKNLNAIKPVTGLDIKQYANAKKFWQATFNYIYELTGEKSARDMVSFQTFVNEQFSRDKQFISLVMQGADPIKKAAQLEGQFNTLYECTFKDYVGFIKGINDAENGAFKDYVKYLEHTLETLNNKAIMQGADIPIKSGESLFNIKDISPEKVTEALQNAIKKSKDSVELADQLYTIKMNDAYVNSILINDPVVADVLMNINSSEQVGAFLNKTIGAAKSLEPDANAQISVAVRTIKEAGASFANIKTLYDEIASAILVSVKGIKDSDFKKYVIDQIFGLKDKTVTELLAGFDSITMPSLKNGLETLLYKEDFKFSDYPALEDQIAGIYKRFLEAQQQAGVTNVNAAIVEDFTKSIDDLITSMSQFENEFQELAVANVQIKTILSQVKNTNVQMLENLFTTKATIFKVFDTRQLTDMGLALKTVAIKQNLDLFDLTADLSGNIISSANYLGKSINRLVESLNQYQVVFTKDIGDKISQAYSEFRKMFLDNPDYAETLQHPAFKFLKPATNSIEQFAHLVEFNKMAKDSVDSKAFKDILRQHLPTETYLNIINPSRLLVTDFAWSPMAQSAWIAKTQFNESIVNAVNLYRNFDLSVQKGFSDFSELRDALSKNKLDRVNALQAERYTRALSEYATFFDEMKTYYDSLFDKALAEAQIENVRNILIRFPELNKKYSKLVDDLEKYWNGELELKQDLKEYVKAGVLPDGTKAVDEVTPFHNALKEMNNEIENTIHEYNTQVAQRHNENYLQFKNLQTQNYETLMDTNAETKAFLKQNREQIHQKHYDTLLNENKVAKAEFKTQREALEKSVYGDVYTPQRDAALNEVRQDFLDTKNSLYKQTVADFNKVLNAEEIEARQALDGIKFENPERQALYYEFRENKRYVFGPEKPHEFKDLEKKIADNLETDFATDFVDELRLAYLEYEHTYATADRAAILKELRLAFKDASADDIDALNLWYTSKPITKYKMRPVRGSNGQIIKWKIVGEKTKEEMLKDIARGISIQPIFEELSNLYRSTLGTKYQELFAPISKHLFEEYLQNRSKTVQELFTRLVKNNEEYNTTREAYYQMFLQNIDKNYATYLANNELEQNEFFTKVVSPKFEQAFQKYTEANEQALENYLQLKQEIEELTPYLISPKTSLWDPVKKQQELNRLISKATDMNAQGALYNMFNKTYDEFANELAYRMRFITFNEADVADGKLNVMFNKFNRWLPDNIKFVHDVKNHRYWYILDPSQELTMSGRQVYLNGNPIVRMQKHKTFDEFKMVDAHVGTDGPKFTEMLNKLQDTLYEFTGTSLGDSQGEYLTQEMLEKIYLQMPEEVQKLLPKLDDWTNKQFFEACRFNESILGSSASRRELGLYSTNQLINAKNALQGAIGYTKPKNEYINAVFNSTSSIASPNSVYANFTDQEIMDALITNPEYKLVALVEDKKYGIKTREILPTSVEAIQKAKELGAVIIPTQTYKDMYNVVNHRLGSSGMAKLWSRIMYVYKFGYLLNPAAWARNWFDTNIKSRLAMGSDFDEYNQRAKTMLEDIKDMKDYVKAQEKKAFKRAETEYETLAYRIFEEKDRIEKFIQRRSRDGIIKEDLIKEWFAQNKARILTYDAYKELQQDFLSQGISGNVMADLYKGSGGDLWNTFTQITGNIVEFGNKFENSHRLAMYLYELDRGTDYSTALSKIAKIHFDYSFKTKAEQLSEMVFPFTTFSLRNYSYWIEMLEKHPWIMRNYIHLMKPNWDFKDYTPEELARDRSVQAQILYGQLKLGEFNNKLITFKLNPSVQDAIQMASDPINNIYSRLAAPAAAIRDMAKGEEVNILNTIPIAGPIVQTAQKSIQTGSPLHSLIGVRDVSYKTHKTIKWSNPNLSGTDKYTDSTYRTPKYRKNVIYDSYATKGITRYRTNYYPLIDIAHDIKMRYTTNVYNRIKNRVKTDVYQDIRYRMKLDVNRFR